MQATIFTHDSTATYRQRYAPKRQASLLSIKWKAAFYNIVQFSIIIIVPARIGSQEVRICNCSFGHHTSTTNRSIIIIVIFFIRPKHVAVLHNRGSPLLAAVGHLFLTSAIFTSRDFFIEKVRHTFHKHIFYFVYGLMGQIVRQGKLVFEFVQL